MTANDIILSAISDIPAASTLNNEDLFLITQSNTDKTLNFSKSASLQDIMNTLSSRLDTMYVRRLGNKDEFVTGVKTFLQYVALQTVNTSNTKSAVNLEYLNNNYPTKVALGNYLPLSGGTVTGTILFLLTNALANNASNRSLYLFGGKVADDSAQLQLHGPSVSDSNMQGAIQMKAKKGSNEAALLCKADGSITWKNKNLVRSVDGIPADSTGNVTTNYIKAQVVANLPASPDPNVYYFVTSK